MFYIAGYFRYIVEWAAMNYCSNRGTQIFLLTVSMRKSRFFTCENNRLHVVPVHFVKSLGAVVEAQSHSRPGYSG